MSSGWIVFLGRRLLILAVLLVIVSFGLFALAYLTPGNPLRAYLGMNQATPQLVAQLRAEFHLNDPFLDQYWLWFRNAIQLQFGKSIATGLSVNYEIGQALPSSIYLGLYAYLLTIVAGCGLGVASALRRQRFTDQAIVSTSVVALSMPGFVASILLIYVFAILVPVFPAAGPGTGVAGEIWHLTLPAVALALAGIGFVLKHTRAATVAVLDQDYVVFARARGLSMWRVLSHYVVRNALIPVITMSGFVLAFVLTGAVIVETAFSLPGLGSLLQQAGTNKDIPTIQGVGMVVAMIILGCNLLADIGYLLADPRIRLGEFQR